MNKTTTENTLFSYILSHNGFLNPLPRFLTASTGASYLWCSACQDYEDSGSFRQGTCRSEPEETAAIEYIRNWTKSSDGGTISWVRFE